MIRTISNFISTRHNNEELHHSNVVAHLREQVLIQEANIDARKRQWEEISRQSEDVDAQRLQVEALEREDLKQCNELSARLLELRDQLTHQDGDINKTTKLSAEDLSLLENLTSQLPALTRELNEKEKQYESLLSTKRILEKSLDPLRKQNEILKKDLQDSIARAESTKDTVEAIEVSIQEATKANRVLSSENVRLEQCLDAALNSRGLSRVEYARFNELETQVAQLANEKYHLEKEQEKLQEELNQVAEEREKIAQERARCQLGIEELSARHDEIVWENNKLIQKLRKKEQELANKIEAHSLTGRLKRRLEALQHENAELKRTKLELQQSLIPRASE